MPCREAANRIAAETETRLAEVVRIRCDRRNSRPPRIFLEKNAFAVCLRTGSFRREYQTSEVERLEMRRDGGTRQTRMHKLNAKVENSVLAQTPRVGAASCFSSALPRFLFRGCVFHYFFVSHIPSFFPRQLARTSRRDARFINSVCQFTSGMSSSINRLALSMLFVSIGIMKNRLSKQSMRFPAHSSIFRLFRLLSFVSINIDGSWACESHDFSPQWEKSNRGTVKWCEIARTLGE